MWPDAFIWCTAFTNVCEIHLGTIEMNETQTCFKSIPGFTVFPHGHTLPRPMGTSVHVYLPAGKTEHKATSIQEGSIGLDVPPTHATNSASLDLELALQAKTGNKRRCRESLPEKSHDLALWGDVFPPSEIFIHLPCKKSHRRQPA